MLHAFGFRSRTTRALAGALVGLLTLAGTAAADTAVSRIGAAEVQGGGFVGFDQTIAKDLINNGETYGVITGGSCWANPLSSVVFEGQLAATESGDGSWAGDLHPVGALTEAVAGSAFTEGKVQLFPIDEHHTRVTAYLDGSLLPAGTVLTICLRQATDTPPYEPVRAPSRPNLPHLPHLPHLPGR